MKQILMTGGLTVLLDDEDYQQLSKWRWFAQTSPGSKRPYVARMIWINTRGSKRIIYMHRVIAKAEKHQHVDHCNGNSLDNRRSNLRVATVSQNGANMISVRAQSGLKGVHLCKDKRWHRNKIWRARIKVNYKDISLGYFVDPKEAAKAYDKAARHYFGEFARLNFPDTDVAKVG